MNHIDVDDPAVEDAVRANCKRHAGSDAGRALYVGEHGGATSGGGQVDRLEEEYEVKTMLQRFVSLSKGVSYSLMRVSMCEN